MRLHVRVVKVGAKEPDAAIDVVADASRRNDAALFRVGGTDAADAEAVTPVDVGHGQAGVLDAGQKSHIGNLFRGLVIFQLREQFLTAENQPIDAHTRLVAARNPPAAIIDSFEGSSKAFLGHDESSKGHGSRPYPAHSI